MYQRLMSATKTLFFSVTGGLIIATILHGVALSVGNRTLGKRVSCGLKIGCPKGRAGSTPARHSP